MAEVQRKSPEHPRRFVSPEQLAETLPGVSKGTLAAWRYEAKGPRYYKLGRKVVYDLDEVLAWVQANARQGTAEKATA